MICAEFLLVVCTIIYTVELCVAENLLNDFLGAETDEEEKIKEALLLVELLKNEYSKKIKDFKMKQTLLSLDTTVENSTCPMTTLSESELQNTTSSIANGTISGAAVINITESTADIKAVYSSTSQNPLEYSESQNNMMPMRRRWSQLQHAIIPQYEIIPESVPIPNDIPNRVPLDFYRRRHRFYRRKMPDYLYYYDEPSEMHGQLQSMSAYNNNPPRPIRRNFRRFENDIDLQSKAETSTTPTMVTPSLTSAVTSPNATNATTVSSTTSTMTMASSTYTSSNATKTFPRKTTSKMQSTTNSQFTPTDEITMRIIKGQKKTAKAKIDSTTNMHNKNEIKDPIIEEVAAEYLRELNGTRTTLKRKAKKKRTTLKLFLGGSTPYHLPLPENHAFCYTNPESSLCRTYI